MPGSAELLPAMSPVLTHRTVWHRPSARFLELVVLFDNTAETHTIRIIASSIHRITTDRNGSLGRRIAQERVCCVRLRDATFGVRPRVVKAA